MPIPNLSLQTSATAGANTGATHAAGTLNGGEMVFGGSGKGGAIGGGLGGAVAKYWPVLLAAGAIWYFRKKLT